SPGLALTSWIAIMKMGDHSMMMGDLVLLDKEVAPVISKLISENLQITAIHNHLVNETPAIKYIHFSGTGDAAKLAEEIKLVIASGVNFQKENDKTAITGDFVLLAEEVNLVVKALTENGIAVTAIHNHMLFDSPRLFMLHFWAVDEPEKLARGLKAALDKTN